MSETRRWTAVIEIDGYTPSDAPISTFDLQRDQAATAVGHTKHLLNGLGLDDATVVLRKTTRAGTRNDLIITVSRNGDRWQVH